MSHSFFYITTTLPYVNATPHIGFALEIVAADVIARYQRLLGSTVVFNTGTDEHGQKIYQKALENGKQPQAYVDYFANQFAQLKQLLNLSYTNFIRTTDDHHIKAAQEFWRRCDANGYMYKDEYAVKYCVGCELEKTESELVDGYCPLHPGQELEIRQEENYFFKFSAFQDQLLELYQNNPTFVQPEGKMKEIKSFVTQGIQDFSISRLKEKMPWGIPVPGDDDHVMYVWFDALVNYISTLGWPDDETNFEKFWPGIQLAGKDNLRQQSAMWQAMLMSVDLPPSQQILINGFIGINGQKMSKSLGNVISPTEMVDRYGIEATRYLLMNLGPFGEDIDVSWDKLDTAYTAKLANSLGNLCSRVSKLAEQTQLLVADDKMKELDGEYQSYMDAYQLSAALNWIDQQMAEADHYLSEHKPWKLTGSEQEQILQGAISKILSIATHLQPFMPTVSQQILDHFQGQVSALEPMFPRL